MITASATADRSVSDLAGRCSQHFRNGNVDGDVYWTDDVVEIVPIDKSHAYLGISQYRAALAEWRTGKHYEPWKVSEPPPQPDPALNAM